MCLPASIALLSRSARIWVVAASKKTSSLEFFSAASRSVVERSMPYCRASAASFSALRPTNIGSGITRSPFGSLTPPCARIATIERTRCWLSPMRPVTPTITMPSLRVATCRSSCRPLRPRALLARGYNESGRRSSTVPAVQAGVIARIFCSAPGRPVFPPRFGGDPSPRKAEGMARRSAQPCLSSHLLFEGAAPLGAPWWRFRIPGPRFLIPAWLLPLRGASSAHRLVAPCSVGNLEQSQSSEAPRRGVVVPPGRVPGPPEYRLTRPIRGRHIDRGVVAPAPERAMPHLRHRPLPAAPSSERLATTPLGSAGHLGLYARLRISSRGVGIYYADRPTAPEPL